MGGDDAMRPALPRALVLLGAIGLAWAAPPRSAPAASPAGAGEPRETAVSSDPAIPPARPVDVEGMIERGVRFLLRTQNPDGSWGSAHRTKGLNIYAPVPGAHHAFRAAVTGLVVAALHDVAAGRPEVEAALDRAQDWLFRKLPHVRRATPDALYNVWAHSYSIQGIVRLWRRARGDAGLRDRLVKLAASQVDMLRRYEAVNGGWGYYDFDFGTQKPAGSPTSFTTATALVALAEGREMGLEIPRRLVDRALASLRRQRKSDFSYMYGEYLRMRPMRLINRPGGSLGRSQACNVAMRCWGDRTVTDAVLQRWLERLWTRNLWLDIGRKRPVPHEAWFQVAGYFYYYGHYYAALCIEELPAARRGVPAARLAALLARHEEKDGSWWDYPFYDYHQPYGTAFALMALARCRAVLGEGAAAGGEEGAAAVAPADGAPSSASSPSSWP